MPKRHFVPAALAAIVAGSALLTAVVGLRYLPHPPSPAASLPPVHRSAGQPGGTGLAHIIGAGLLDRNGERVRTVADVLVDRDARVSAVIVRVGWILGVPTRDVAVPAGHVRLVPGAGHQGGERGAEAVPEGSETGSGTDYATILDALMTSGGAGRGGGEDHVETDLTRSELLETPAFSGG
ncbi:PRC-barrel domain-containing protein [Antarcticirhabdus aurantiaca]|uniref:PRC-barrel domain-containing protein n=1 Tax=Antarcticirhabdus aurantiaca TaxID=2606717 RepID=A0ACD4NKC4_9HYPH|nr:PRC-barrel domain-containing protein [Antarcticirhabdus aurantiaca]WAJ27248.1 PRC-barrel domain-containing protein [Jeongeuplla avenae]